MRSSKSASKLSQVADQAKVQAADLGERVGPTLDEARERLDEARERLTPMVEDARDRFVPAAEKAAHNAREAAQHAADRARPHAQAAKLAATAATAKGARKVATALDERLPDERTPAVISAASERKKGGKLKKLLFVAGLGGAVAFVVKRLRSEPAPTWQSVPPPSPTAPAPAPSGAAAGTAGTAGTAGVTASAPQSGTESAAAGTRDAAGASPDEAAADRTEEPHVPTTPDNPAEEVDLKKT